MVNKFLSSLASLFVLRFMIFFFLYGTESKKTKTNQPKKAILTKASNHRCFLKKCKKYINFTEKHLCLQLRRYKSTRGIPSFFKGWILILVKMGHILRPRKFLISLLVDFLKAHVHPPVENLRKDFRTVKHLTKFALFFICNY